MRHAPGSRRVAGWKQTVPRGNTSLAGAGALAASPAARTNCQALAKHIKHVELGNDLNVQMAFAEAMIFPGLKKGHDKIRP
ncbi:MAG: DUF4445 domain-containing protein, partial [Phycisphaerales bacterium]|nr:DUF4445 domain-containing protein [Phycisphaerales bacterium]